MHRTGFSLAKRYVHGVGEGGGEGVGEWKKNWTQHNYVWSVECGVWCVGGVWEGCGRGVWMVGKRNGV